MKKNTHQRCQLIFHPAVITAREKELEDIYSSNGDAERQIADEGDLYIINNFKD